MCDAACATAFSRISVASTGGPGSSEATVSRKRSKQVWVKSALVFCLLPADSRLKSRVGSRVKPPPHARTFTALSTKAVHSLPVLFVRIEPRFKIVRSRPPPRGRPNTNVTFLSNRDRALVQKLLPSCQPRTVHVRFLVARKFRDEVAATVERVSRPAAAVTATGAPPTHTGPAPTRLTEQVGELAGSGPGHLECYERPARLVGVHLAGGVLVSPFLCGDGVEVIGDEEHQEKERRQAYRHGQAHANLDESVGLAECAGATGVQHDTVQCLREVGEGPGDARARLSAPTLDVTAAAIVDFLLMTSVKCRSVSLRVAPLSAFHCSLSQKCRSVTFRPG